MRTICALALLLCGAHIGHAQTNAVPSGEPTVAREVGKDKDAVPPAAAPNQSDKQELVQKEQALSNGPVLSNGALAVPGAPATGETVPAKFSKKNDHLDHLTIAAYTLMHLTDAEKSEIRTKLAPPADSSPLPAETKVGALVPAAQGMKATVVPPDLADRIPGLSGLAFAGTGSGAVAMINPRTHQVVAVIE